MEQLAPPQPGDLVGGKYRIERVLGQGGMGVVFEASHHVTEKRFAIKWLLSEPTRSDDSVTRFIREAQVAGRCEHRNIVEVYDIDREAGTLFMVMELLKGESLADRLAQHGRIFYREACRLLVPCVEAVGEAHAAGIIHRDLKPGNIFICRARGREPELAKVLDFGVSRFAVTPDSLAGAKTKSGAVVGTPFYMAPEQMRGLPIDERVDVYSMGVTLYEVLAGVRPYDAGSYGDLLLKVAEARPTPLARLVKELPAGLSEVVTRAMAYDVTARFPSMEALARALEPYVNHGPNLTIQAVGSWREGSHSGDTPWVAEASLVHGRGAAGARRRWLWGGVGVGVSSVAALLWLTLGRGEETAVSPSTTAPAPALSAPPPSAAEASRPLEPKAVNPVADSVVTPVESAPGHASPPASDAGVPLPSGVTPDHPLRRAHRAQPSAGERTPRFGQAPHRDDSAETPPPASPRENRPRAKTRAPATMQRSDF